MAWRVTVTRGNSMNEQVLDTQEEAEEVATTWREKYPKATVSVSEISQSKHRWWK